MIYHSLFDVSLLLISRKAIGIWRKYLHNFSEVYQAMNKGVFITFEGIDGCGKTLMQKKTEKWLQDKGYTVLTTREPGGSDLGLRFREMLLDSAYGSVDPTTETLMFMADRSRHVAEIILPALNRGEIVLCDRYTDSTAAYQGGGSGLSMEQINTLNDFAVSGLYPDLTLVLQLPLTEAAKRLHGEKDRMEQEDADFFSRVSAAYEDIARAEPQRVRLIDASVGVEEVFAQIKAAVTELLSVRG